MSYEEINPPIKSIEQLPESTPFVQPQQQPLQQPLLENIPIIKPQQPKGKKKHKIFIIVVVLILISTLGISAYNFYILQGSNWECFTDKCIEYYPKQEWLEDNCIDEICKFRYQNQDQSVLKYQLEEFPADHSIFCKSFSCDTQILRRAG